MKLLDPGAPEHGLDVRVLNGLEGWTGRMGSAYECAKRTVACGRALSAIRPRATSTGRR